MALFVFSWNSNENSKVGGMRGKNVRARSTEIMVNTRAPHYPIHTIPCVCLFVLQV